MFDPEGTNQEGRKVGASNPSCSLGQANVLRGWGNRHVEMLVMQVLIGGPENLAICGKGVSILNLHSPLASERVWRSSPCSFGSVGDGGGMRLVPSAAGGQSSGLCTRFSCMTCSLGLLTLEDNSVSP